MEIQIDDLVQSIKRDGIEQARKDADAIVAEARQQAAEIIAASKAEAEKNREDFVAKKEVRLASVSAIEKVMKDVEE